MKDDLEGIALNDEFQSGGVIIFDKEHSLYCKMGELSKNARRVFDAVLYYMGYETNLIVMCSDTLDKIVQSTELSAREVKRLQTELVRSELIEPTKELKCEYVVRPSFVWKGSRTSTWNSYMAMVNRHRKRKGLPVNKLYLGEE